MTRMTARRFSRPEDRARYGASRRALLRGTALILAAIAITDVQSVHAQPQTPAWPAKPLRIVVPFPPGGANDTVARTVGPLLAARLGQPVTIENRPGGGSNLAMEAVARSDPDGHTILFASVAAAINPALYRMSFDPQRDLAPVVLLTRLHLMLFARAGLEATTVSDVLRLARMRPGAITCAASAGGTPQMGCELLQSLGEVRIVNVLYKGSSLSMLDLAAGHVDIAMDMPAAAAAHVASGRVKPLGVADQRPHTSRFGRLPLIADSIPGFELNSWGAMFVAAGTPGAVIERLNREFNAILLEPAVRLKLREIDGEPGGGSPQDLADRLRADTATYARIARNAGLRPSD